MLKVLVAAILVTVVVFSVLGISYQIKHSPSKCFKGHYQHCHQEPYMYFIQSGDVMVPIWNPAQDYDVWICDKHREE